MPTKIPAFAPKKVAAVARTPQLKFLLKIFRHSFHQSLHKKIE
jgi:hypothetical protein